MSIKLTDKAREEAIGSIQAYFRDERDEEVGSIAAGSVLEFVLEEIGPSIHNQAVREAQQRMQVRLMDLDAELHEEEFPYWPRRRAR